MLEFRELWPACRLVDGMSQQGNDKAIGAALTEVFSDWLVNRPDVFVTSRCGMRSRVDP